MTFPFAWEAFLYFLCTCTSTLSHRCKVLRVVFPGIAARGPQDMPQHTPFQLSLQTLALVSISSAMLLFPLQQCKAETTCTIEAQYMFVILIKKIICQAEETGSRSQDAQKSHGTCWL